MQKMITFDDFYGRICAQKIQQHPCHQLEGLCSQRQPNFLGYSKHQNSRAPFLGGSSKTVLTLQMKNVQGLRGIPKIFICFECFLGIISQWGTPSTAGIAKVYNLFRHRVW